MSRSVNDIVRKGTSLRSVTSEIARLNELAKAPMIADTRSLEISLRAMEAAVVGSLPQSVEISVIFLPPRTPPSFWIISFTSSSPFKEACPKGAILPVSGRMTPTFTSSAATAGMGIRHPKPTRISAPTQENNFPPRNPWFVFITRSPFAVLRLFFAPKAHSQTMDRVTGHPGFHHFLTTAVKGFVNQFFSIQADNRY